MDFQSFISEGYLILIPVIYIIGIILKEIKVFPDKYIPLALLAASIALCMGKNGICVDAVIQGILIVGTAVYANQTYKQIKK